MNVRPHANVEIWGDLDGGPCLPAYAPARTFPGIDEEIGTGIVGGVDAMTRASSQPPLVQLDVLGGRVRIEAGGHPAAAQVDALWSRCRASTSGTGRDSRDDRDDRNDPDDSAGGAEGAGETVISLPRTDRPLTPAAGLELSDRIRRLALDAAADRLMVLRAAAVSTPDGSVLALVAPDETQRATVAAELSRRGFGYVTDELVACTEAFEVVAFPEPLRFEQDDPESLTLAGPDALGMRACPHGTLRLVATVLLRHEPAHRGTPQLSLVEQPDDVRRLEEALVSTPAGWGTTALPDMVDEVGGVYELEYGEIHAAAPVLAELVLRRALQPAGPGQLYVAVGIGDSDDRPVAVSGHHLALDGLRRVVWMAAAGGASLEELHLAANRQLPGQRPVSPQRVAAAVRDLMALGLLVLQEGVRGPALVDSGASER